MRTRRCEKMIDREKLAALSDPIHAFSILLKSDNLDESSVVTYTEMKIKSIKEYVTAVHPYSIYSHEQRRSNGTPYTLWATEVYDADRKRHRVQAMTKDELYGKLFAFYDKGELCLQKKNTLEDYFGDFLRDKAKYVTAKSVKEYVRLWGKYYAKNPLVKIPLKDLKAKDLKNFFVDTCLEYGLSKKQFMDMKNVIANYVKYLVEENLLHFNPVKDLDFKKIPYHMDAKAGNIRTIPFTAEQTKRVIAWCGEQMENPKVHKIYPLAILFNISIGLRRGELAALRWTDVDFENGTLTVAGQVVANVIMDENFQFTTGPKVRVDHNKCNEAARVIPLLPMEMDYLNQVKALNLSDEYIFPESAGEFRYHTFNDKVKQAAKAIGLDPKNYHSHTLRATAATNTYNACQDIRQVQVLLGHTTPEMTDKYVHNNRGLDSLRSARTAVTNEILEK